MSRGIHEGILTLGPDPFMARGNNGRPIFRDDADRRCFLETLQEAW